MSNSSTKILTLCIIHQQNRILLGMKKRGFGMGRWNGFGGKVQEGETIEQAAIRELEEEAGITPRDLKPRGILTFHFENDPIALQVHLFSATELDGEPGESEEMKPHWFQTHNIPYAEMWPDDPYWLPQVLEGKNVQGEFFFKDSNRVSRYTLKTL